MSVANLRKDLEHIRASAQAGDLDQVVRTVDHALQALDRSRLLTTTEAAELLGIRSVNTFKLLIRRSGVSYELHGNQNRMIIPISSLKKLQQSAALHGIWVSDQAHNAIDALGEEHGLTDQQLQDLSAARPARLPWRAEKTQSWRRGVEYLNGSAFLALLSGGAE